MSTMKSLACTYTNGIIKFFYFTSNFFQLGCGSFQMFRNNILYGNISTCCCCCKHEGSCFNLIRNDRILCAVKLLYTFNTDHISTCALNVRTHAVQEIGNVYNMGLSGCVLNNGTSGSQGSSHHNIDRCTNRYNIQKNMTAMEVFCFSNNCSMKNIYRCSKCPESFQMLVNRTASDVTASRKRHFCMFIFAK